MSGIILYLLSFIAIWFGAGLIINSVDRISHKLNLSSFAISFFILGILTSIPETAVSINSVIDHKPEIFVGTLLGGVVVIFLLVIPVLAIFGNGISIHSGLSKKHLLLSLGVIAAPGLTLIDQKVTNFEGFLLILAYLYLFYTMQKHYELFSSERKEVLGAKVYSSLDLGKTALGIVIVFLSGEFIVSQTLSYASMLNVSVFYLSLLLLSFGTNLPELSLAVRAVASGKKDIAFGDYLGSAAANTLLFGIFTILNDGEFMTVNNFSLTFIFIALSLSIFYFFAKSHRNISRTEGIILLLLYLGFVTYEISRGIL